MEKKILWSLSGIGAFISMLGVALVIQMFGISSTNAEIKENLKHANNKNETQDDQIQEMRIDILQNEQKQTQKVHALEIKILQRSR